MAPMKDSRGDGSFTTGVQGSRTRITLGQSALFEQGLQESSPPVPGAVLFCGTALGAGAPFSDTTNVITPLMTKATSSSRVWT
jgi:hypothetical protein